MTPASALTVFGIALWKQLPAFGAAAVAGLAPAEAGALCLAGSLTSTALTIGLGAPVMRLIKARLGGRTFGPSTRRNVKLWRRFGFRGLISVCPMFLSPLVVGSLALAFGETPRRVGTGLVVGAFIWAALGTLGWEWVR